MKTLKKLKSDGMQNKLIVLPVFEYLNEENEVKAVKNRRKIILS